MGYKDAYRDWLSWCDDAEKKELLLLKDEKEIEDRFYKDLEFGTAGLRGIMGAGSNRMNRYNVRKATKGFADYLQDTYGKRCQDGVIIAYDSRNNSADFAAEAAHVLCAAGIPVKFFTEPEPIPVLSFSVRHFRAAGGIVITASHNPKEYNGYKVYGPDGGQLVPRDANVLSRYVENISDLAHIPCTGSKELLTRLGQDTVDLFIEEIYKQSTLKGNAGNLKIVYTPIHGSGNIPVRKILKRGGFTDVHIVESQEKPDGNFPTVSAPNPENQDALQLGIKLAGEIGADIVIGTDPDSDRIGSAVLHNGKYLLISGSSMGALLVNYLLMMKGKELTGKSTIITTIVTGGIGRDIAGKYGVQVEETLTGFKYIGEKMSQYEKDGSHEFIFGYEESYGYLAGTHARDKDAVVTALLICEMADYFKKQGKTLIDVLAELSKEYGYCLDKLSSYTLAGKKGLAKIADIMAALRAKDVQEILPDIEEVRDYAKGIDGLPAENVLKFILKDHSWIAVRPSGTEPKIKIYCSLKGKDEEETSRRFLMYKGIWEREFDL